MAYQPVDIGAAPNDGTGDPIRDAFDKCNDNFVELYAGLTGLLDFKGSTDCSANPNYPAASKGDFYVVSVAGKIGGASGVDVEVGDAYFAEADNAGGTQAAVGTDWSIIQGNTTGAGAGIDIEDEGVSEATGVTTLNFVGAGVVAADMGGGVVDVTIAGGGSGIDVEDEGVSEATGVSTLNFTGAGVTATDMGGGVVDVAISGGGSFRGALVTKVADQTTANYSAGANVAWDSESYDTDSIHDTVTNNSRLTVPSGVTKVRLSFSLALELVAGGSDTYAFLWKNGSSAFVGNPVTTADQVSLASAYLNGVSAAVTVTSGDYFEVRLICADASITVSKDTSWFAMEIIE